MELHILDTEAILQKIDEIHKKISRNKKRLMLATDAEEKEKYSEKLQKLLKKLVKTKIRLYKKDIKNARKLKQNGILIPLEKDNQGSIFTDEVDDKTSLIELAILQNWSDKCLWIDLRNEQQYIIDLKVCRI